MPTITIHDQTSSGDILSSLSLDLLDETLTVRELLRAPIYQEVQDHNLATPSARFRGLVQPLDSENALNGPRTPRQVDWKLQFEKACDAFLHDRILLLIDDHQAISLEEPLTLRHIHYHLPQTRPPRRRMILRNPFHGLAQNPRPHRPHRPAQIATIPRNHPNFYRFDCTTLITAPEQLDDEQPLPENLRSALRKMLDAVSPRPLTPPEERQLAAAAGIAMNNETPWETASPAFEILDRLQRVKQAVTDERKLIARVRRLLSANRNEPAELETAEPWAAAAQIAIDALPPDLRPTWNSLLFHLQATQGPTPTHKWLTQTKALLAPSGKPRFKKFLTSWLPLTPAFRSDLPHVEETVWNNRNGINVIIKISGSWIPLDRDAFPSSNDFQLI